MTTPASWRPATGADSVEFPADATLDGPAGRAAYSRYLRQCEVAAKIETADEAITRCRAEADRLDDGGQRFDDVLDCLLSTFQEHVADLAEPDGDLWRGFSFEESSCFGVWQIDQLRRAYVEMSGAFQSLDRERFRKAAATFAEVVADFGFISRPTPATGPSKGGAE